MKGRQILLEPRGAALIVDGRLEDLLLDAEGGDRTPIPGTIYCARVERLVPKQGAAFVRLDDGQTGYLREAKGRREGERLLVQVIAYAEPGKAAPVTSRVLYKGRLAILTPHAPGINLSRQIKDTDERARLTETAEAALGSQETGLILRTQAVGAEADALTAEIAELLAISAEAEAASDEEPVLTSSAADLARRDWDGVVATGADLFEAAGVWEEIETLKSPRAELRSGGWLSVEATAALVSIDVNTSGQFGGGDALTANLEAAREIPRQLRLRGLGGIVVIDWAPLPKRDRERVEDALKASLKRDPVETTIAGWTPLGLMELTRKRERRPLSELLG